MGFVLWAHQCWQHAGPHNQALGEVGAQPSQILLDGAPHILWVLHGSVWSQVDEEQVRTTPCAFASAYLTHE